MSLAQLKQATTRRLSEAQQVTRRFTVDLPSRDRAVALPKSTKAIQVAVNDPHNPLKVHLFKVYPDRHCYYQQAINGRMFYDSWMRITKKMEYFHLLEDALGSEGLTTLAWHKHRYGNEGV